jgi:hypothetical protein
MAPDCSTGPSAVATAPEVEGGVLVSDTEFLMVV